MLRVRDVSLTARCGSERTEASALSSQNTLGSVSVRPAVSVSYDCINIGSAADSERSGLVLQRWTEPIQLLNQQLWP